jgi:hypothetical protein
MKVTASPQEAEETKPEPLVVPFDQRGAFKLREAAAYGNLSVISLRRAEKRGLLKFNRKFRHILVSRAEMDRFLSA